jgi:hypothetical protein
MKINEIILEHSDWEDDPSYTNADLHDIRKACLAIAQISQTRGIRLIFRDHFFKQMRKMRGFGKTTPDMLIRTFGRILNRGLHLFKGKPEGTDYVFYDKENGLNILFIKQGENFYEIRTMIRDTVWLGTGTKVTL